MENIDVLFFESNVPDEMLLGGYCRTRRNPDMRLEIEGHSCQIYDIGGRDFERGKWFRYFEDVDTVMFVVSLTSYCLALQVPNNAVSSEVACLNSFRRLAAFPPNQMQDSLMLFESISKLPQFRDVPIIVLLNKFDLLEQRMKDHPIRDHYPEYSGDSNPSIARRFFADKFSSLERRLPGRLIIITTSAVEQDDDDFKATIDNAFDGPPSIFRPSVSTSLEDYPP